MKDNRYIKTIYGDILFIKDISALNYNYNGTSARMPDGAYITICNRDARQRIADELQNGAQWFDFSNGTCTFHVNLKEKNNRFNEVYNEI